ncbi:MAG: PPOX class F420-dependent oxidoreductase [Ktedonobacteraceae bacterium]
MTVHDTPTQVPFAYLNSHQYIQLVTYRKNGTAVATPVWFAPGQDKGKLYVMTLEGTGKVKRICSNRHVALAPSDVRGKVLGEQIEARARILDKSEYEQATSALVRKYGLIYRIFTFLQIIRRAVRTFIEIEPV